MISSKSELERTIELIRELDAAIVAYREKHPDPSEFNLYAGSIVAQRNNLLGQTVAFVGDIPKDYSSPHPKQATET